MMVIFDWCFLMEGSWWSLKAGSNDWARSLRCSRNLRNDLNTSLMKRKRTSGLKRRANSREKVVKNLVPSFDES